MRTVSSVLTFPWKVLFPTLFIVGFGLPVLIQWSHNGAAARGSDIQFIAAWIVGSVFLLLSSVRFKQVRIDSANLLVSNYLREIAIPFSAILDVSENRFLGSRPITIHLRESTAFGRRIMFMPKQSFLLPWDAHPVLAELRRLAGLPND